MVGTVRSAGLGRLQAAPRSRLHVASAVCSASGLSRLLVCDESLTLLFGLMRGCVQRYIIYGSAQEVMRMFMLASCRAVQLAVRAWRLRAVMADAGAICVRFHTV